jgi:hypothetical protein
VVQLARCGEVASLWHASMHVGRRKIHFIHSEITRATQKATGAVGGYKRSSLGVPAGAVATKGVLVDACAAGYRERRGMADGGARVPEVLSAAELMMMMMMMMMNLTSSPGQVYADSRLHFVSGSSVGTNQKLSGWVL